MSAPVDPPVVFVTGATGPLGRAVAARYGRTGARLALGGRDADRLNALAADIGLADGSWVPAVGDLADRATAQAAVASVEQRFGRIDVLVHLVGGWAGGSTVVELDPDEVRTMLDRHLWSTLHVLQAVVPGMIERGSGRVLAVSSPLASDPRGKGASYAIAKAAEEVLLRSLARETLGTGVTANLVVVRSIRTTTERESDRVAGPPPRRHPRRSRMRLRSWPQPRRRP